MDRPENVNIQYNNISQLVDAYQSQQHDRLDDDKLFLDGHLKKCQCCFMQLIEIRGPNIIHQWHRETFIAMTRLELSSESLHSNYLCLNCIELLRIFNVMKVAADRMRKAQNRYNEHNTKRSEVVTVKQEVNKGTITITDFDFFEPKIEADKGDDVTLIIDDSDDEFDDEIPQPDMNSTLLPDIDHNLIVDVPVVDFDNQIHQLEIEEINSTVNDEIIVTSSLPTSVSPSSDVHADQSNSVHQFTCDFCGYETDVKALMVHHIDSRHKQLRVKTEDEFICLIEGCNKVCKSKRKMRKHRFDVHDRHSQEDATCEVCGKVCKNKAYLYAHRKAMHSKKQVCKICNKSLNFKYQLLDHIQTYHITNSKFTCSNCSKIFKSQWKLKAHQRNIHDERKFKCDQCNAAFGASRRLADHVKVKHEGKRYHCSYPECSTNNAARSAAGLHLRKYHKLKDEEYKKYYKLLTMH